MRQTAIDKRNLSEVLVDAVHYYPLGQISSALYEVGGKYRRNM